MSARNLSGHRFGKLIVIERGAKPGSRGVYWRVRCDCGSERTVRAEHLTKGHTQSCGCETRARTHGMAESREYKTWEMMIQRCTNPSYDKYEYYGGRGIMVCDRWRGPGGFQNFYADMGQRPDGHTLDRIENSGNYEPSNCRWATRSEQMFNTRRSLKNRRAA